VAFCLNVFPKYYYGIPENVDDKTNKGYTKRFQPWSLIYSKTFENKRDAMAYEKYLKTLKSIILNVAN
jgi:predicted GIY-YIG superfamily endonuclease